MTKPKDWDENCHQKLHFYIAVPNEDEVGRNFLFNKKSELNLFTSPFETANNTTMGTEMTKETTPLH
jgi:hypothetical protein